MKNIRIIALIATALFLQACGSGRVLVIDPIETQDFVSGVRVERDKSTVAVDQEICQIFENHLKEKLNEGGLKEGNDLILRYRFIQVNEGSQFGRWMLGGLGNAGEGTLTAEIRYIRPSGAVIGKAQAEGRIGSGMFGGSFRHAVEQAAAELATYTLNSIKGKAS